DSEGKVLTDMVLLAKLRKLRMEVARQNHLPTYCIFHNNVLAMLATDKPTTREEFLSIRGVGERSYNRFGDLFIQAIGEYIKLR
ncbi:protein containing Helicase and RNase D, partial [human gut metagenome]